MNKDIVKLRKRVSKRTGAAALFLELNRNGRRTYEFLHLYLNPGKDAATKAANAATLEAAKTIQANRIVSIQRGEAEILTKREKAPLLVDYFQEYIEKHPQMSASLRKGLKHTFNRWKDYTGDKLRINEITEKKLLGFAEYLRGDLKRCYIDKHGQRASTPVKLKLNTIRTHYDRIVWVLNFAQSQGVIRDNPATRIVSSAKPKMEKVERGYLTGEELALLIKTPCPSQELKRSFLFACYTGIRKSDVYALTWDNIYNNVVSFRMQKTGDPITIPLSENAKLYLGTMPKGAKGSDHPFSCNSDRQIGRDLLSWAEAAGVKKHVTFHMSRHTFGTLAITYGADLYTVSKLLGHSNLKTTQIYAQIVDKKKEEAVNLIPDFSD